VEYADVDVTVSFTGRQTIYVDGKLIGSAAGLAICIGFSDQVFYLYLCDDGWEVVAVTTANSLSEIKTRAELWYSGIGNKWVKSPYSEEDFRRHLEEQRAEFRCSFCGKWDWEYRELFAGNGVTICDYCVREFYNIAEQHKNPDEN